MDFDYSAPLDVVVTDPAPAQQEPGHIRWLESEQGNFDMHILLQDSEVHLLHLPIAAGGA